jgi:hypothetical protein
MHGNTANYRDLWRNGIYCTWRVSACPCAAGLPVPLHCISGSPSESRIHPVPFPQTTPRRYNVGTPMSTSADGSTQCKQTKHSRADVETSDRLRK